MIAPVHKSVPSTAAPAWHADFLAMLPYLRRRAREAFAHLRSEAREEAVEETLSNVLVAFVRLVDRGKAHPEYARPLVHFAVAQVRQGRRVGARLNSRCPPFTQPRRPRYAQLHASAKRPWILNPPFGIIRYH